MTEFAQGGERHQPRTGEANVPSHGMDAPRSGRTQDTDSAMSALDREVAAAMAAMSPHDLAELSGDVPASDSFEPGKELVGTVVAVTDDDVFIEFGAKSQGVMPRGQFGKKEIVEIGRRVDVVIDSYDAESGLLNVSRKGAAQRATWTNLAPGMLVEGRVSGLIKGGLEVDLKGIRAFMPGSQTDVHPMKDISVLLGQSLKCEVIELDRKSKSVIVSRRKVLEKELAESRDKLRAELEVGQVRKGRVGNIADFGAFVNLGGIDGLIHIRDLAWGPVGKVSDVLAPGQEVEVKVIKIDAKRERISLSLKATQPDPWTNVPDRYPQGTKVKARVLRLADFGAFAELESGIEGLIPVSEMGWGRVRSPGDAVKVGDLVDAVVIRMEPDKRRMALSMKQTTADPWAGVLDSFAPHSLVRGMVTRIADFGAFVEVAPGVEGMVHISEMSEKRIKTCGEVVSVGQEVEARVLGVDKDSRRISLSIKAVKAPSAEAMHDMPEHSPKADRKRKKPLRGGLSSHFEW